MFQKENKLIKKNFENLLILDRKNFPNILMKIIKFFGTFKLYLNKDILMFSLIN